MAAQLSGVAIIICIAFGVLTFLLLFIFANRQIKRFSLKSRSGPHVPIAHDARKVLLIEIDRRLDVVKTISCQPKLLKKGEEALFHDGKNETNNILPAHLYRMKVLDSLANLDACVAATSSAKVRLPEQDLRVYLLRLHQSGATADLSIAVIHQFADLYQHARHEPGDFTYEHYVQFMELLNKIKHSISHRFSSSQQNGNKHSNILSPETVDARKHSSNGKVAELPRIAQPET